MLLCRDLCLGVGRGRNHNLRHIAQPGAGADRQVAGLIPAEEPAEAPAAEDAAEGSDGMNQKTTVQRDKNPLDMGDVTVILWSIE